MVFENFLAEYFLVVEQLHRFDRVDDCEAEINLQCKMGSDSVKPNYFSEVFYYRAAS